MDRVVVKGGQHGGSSVTQARSNAGLSSGRDGGDRSVARFGGEGRLGPGPGYDLAVRDRVDTRLRSDRARHSSRRMSRSNKSGRTREGP